jgi:chromosome partitioning protein
VRTIAIVNQKGGCGKTTTAINLAGVCASKGLRTLLVDLDPQSHCAVGLAIPESRIDIDIGDAMLADPATPLDATGLLWRVSRNLDLAPSRMKLAGLEASRGGLHDLPDKELRLRGVIDRLATDHDMCVIDCSPAIGLLTYNALAAADLVLVPVETGFFALQGATRQIETIKTIGRRLGSTPEYWLLPTIHDADSALSADLLEELRRRFGNRVLNTVIRRDASLREAASFGQPIIEYAPTSRGAEDYSDLARWLIETALPDTPPPPRRKARPLNRAVQSKQNGDTGPIIIAPSSPDALTHEGESTPAVTTTSRVAVPISRAQDLAARARKMTGDASPGSPLYVAEHVEPKPPVLPPMHQIEHLFGVRQIKRGVLFVQPITVGRRVCLAGDFNGWSADATPMRRNEQLGVFEACLPLDPGPHEYRLVIDGQWSADPYNDASQLNPFGQINSVVDVTQMEEEPVAAPSR